LESLGLSSSQIRRIFTYMGFILGSLGTFVGVGIGLSLILIMKFSHFRLPEAYGFTELPLAINVITVIALLIGTPLIASIVAFFPALRFTRASVSEVLRYS